jgi:hypothetical protein
MVVNKKHLREQWVKRQRACRTRKKVRSLNESEDFFRAQLAKCYESKKIEPGAWMSATDFYNQSVFAGLLPLEEFQRGLKNKNIETSTLHQTDSRDILLVRPAWFLTEKGLIIHAKQ